MNREKTRKLCFVRSSDTLYDGTSRSYDALWCNRIYDASRCNRIYDASRCIRMYDASKERQLLHRGGDVCITSIFYDASMYRPALVSSWKNWFSIKKKSVQSCMWVIRYLSGIMIAFRMPLVISFPNHMQRAYTRAFRWANNPLLHQIF